MGLPVTHWSAPLLGICIRAAGLAISDRTVSRILREAKLQPHRQKMWLTSHDDEFRQKRDDVLRLYYETPIDEHVVWLDEKTGMQALERRFADVSMKPGQPVRREFEYVRHGTLCLMGAYDVRRRKLFGFCSEDHDSSTFVALLDAVDRCYPKGRGHLVFDNLSAHDTDEVLEWFHEHPRWTPHFTPKHASWLNHIECAFSLLGRQLLARGSFASIETLAEAVYAYMLWFNALDAPAFEWTYRPKSWAKGQASVQRQRVEKSGLGGTERVRAGARARGARVALAA